MLGRARQEGDLTSDFLIGSRGKVYTGLTELIGREGKLTNIPVIDLFAGPGGLGEGFSAYKTAQNFNPFRIGLSIEKDSEACLTLLLRSFYRQFHAGKAPEQYYEFIRGNLDLDKLFRIAPKAGEAARQEVWQAELGKVSEKDVDRRIKQVLGGASRWVLVGGPPCQAYSIVGRVRMRGENPEKFEADHRHFLYREYLRIIEKHAPLVFVMENVKGILSASVKGQQVLNQILQDMDRLGYRVYSFASEGRSVFGVPIREAEFVLRCEEYGIPQTRHRVILLGIRKSYDVVPAPMLPATSTSCVKDAISDLPRLRSQLSTGEDSADNWARAIKGILHPDILTDKVIDKELKRIITANVVEIDKNLTPGGEFVAREANPKFERAWSFDPRLQGVCNHATRAHIPEDLRRYFFASCFAERHGRAPILGEFPAALLPAHANIQEGVEDGLFKDRFRVQVANQAATTITSHISKDGHYFIHPDPLQCRSLTVREAARLQTFPDNYWFAGPRTSQYKQVGNAVPPLIARSAARIVHDILEAGRVSRSKDNGSSRKGKTKLEHVADPVSKHRT